VQGTPTNEGLLGIVNVRSVSARPLVYSLHFALLCKGNAVKNRITIFFVLHVEDIVPTLTQALMGFGRLSQHEMYIVVT